MHPTPRPPTVWCALALFATMACNPAGGGQIPSTGSPTGTATGTPTGTATGTPTVTATGTPTGTEPAAAPARVLFIGNSFTYWNNGVESEVQSLRRETGDTAFEAQAFTEGGASLKTLWEQTNVLNAINSGGFDVVALQEDIPETNISNFHEYARLFDTAIRDTGATPLLFMAWDYDRLGWISMDEIADAHFEIALELGVPVAPVGLAWKRAMDERPSLDMYDNDDEHPSVHGTYLAATTIYGVLFDENPVGLTYRPGGVSADEADFLQTVAWDEIQAN